MGDLALEFSEQGNVVIGMVAGVLDTTTASQFDQAIMKYLESGHRQFVVDLAELTYMSSAGIGALLGTRNDAEDVGGDLRISRMPPAIAKVLDVLDVLEYFQVFDTVDTAVSSY